MTNNAGIISLHEQEIRTESKMDYAAIRKYAEDNNEPNLSSEELDHVAMCMEHIQRWYYEDYPLGDFLTAVVNNDLTEAVFRADDVNIRALKLYAYFLTWNIPADWRTKTNLKERNDNRS